MTPNMGGRRRQAKPDTPEETVAMSAQSAGLAAASSYTGTDEGTRRTLSMQSQVEYKLGRLERKRKQEEEQE
jgi:serine protease inhibitor